MPVKTLGDACLEGAGSAGRERALETQPRGRRERVPTLGAVLRETRVTLPRGRHAARGPGPHQLGGSGHPVPRRPFCPR